MRRFWFPERLMVGGQVRVSGDLFHHIHQVNRLGCGEELELLSGDQQAFLVQIEEVTSRDLVVSVKGVRSIPPPRGPKLVLAVSLPRFQRFDWILEKAVELGVSEIVPFTSERSFVRSSQEVSSSRRERWQKVIAAATQQSARGDQMSVTPVLNFGELQVRMNRNPGSLCLLPYENSKGVSISEALRGKDFAGLQEIWTLVGSEGGFSSSEVATLKNAGAIEFTLGEQILRVETACVVMVAILKYHGHLWSKE